MTKPWIRVDVDMADNAKIVGLSSAGARWAAVKAMMRAKTRSPQGQFESRSVFDHLLGEDACHLDELVAAGLLEVAPAVCKRCRTRFSGRIRAATIVVHDFGDKQPSSTERVKEWREKNGGLNGHETLSERRGNGFPAVTPTVTQSLPSRALSPSPSLSVVDGIPLDSGVVGGGGPGEEPDGLGVVETWLANHHLPVVPGSRTETRLARLVDRHGASALIEAVEQLPKPLDDVAQAVYGAVKVLEPIRGPVRRQPEREPAPGPTAEETRRRLADMAHAADHRPGSLADLGVARPGTITEVPA